MTRLRGTAGTPNTILFGAAAGALVVLAVAAWFLVVAPKRSEAADLRVQIAAAKEELASRHARGPSVPGAGSGPVTVSEAQTLAQAMPDSAQMSSLVRRLDRLARRAGVTLDTITPQTETPGAGYRSIPLTVVVDGRFFAIQRFLRLVRTQVQVRGGRVQGRGRLLDVQAIDLQQAEGAGSSVRATLTMQAFVYAGGAQAAAAAQASASAAGASG
jgi:Tfp pilus assembly protein PilO